MKEIALKETKEVRASHSSVNGTNLGGFTSFGQDCNTSITWNGEATKGVDPIDVVRAVLHRVQWMQEKTTAASEPNARLLVKLMQAVEEFDGKPPSIGGELNNLIPKE
jgi:hypothetical protein